VKDEKVDHAVRVGHNTRGGEGSGDGKGRHARAYYRLHLHGGRIKIATNDKRLPQIANHGAQSDEVSLVSGLVVCVAIIGGNRDRAEPGGVYGGNRGAAGDGRGERGGGESKGDGKTHTTLVSFESAQGRGVEETKFLACGGKHGSGMRGGIGSIKLVNQMCFLNEMNMSTFRGSSKP
jgi:hypothetical protein